MTTIPPNIQLELAREIARKLDDRETKARLKQLESRLLWPSTERHGTLAAKSEFMEQREARAAQADKRDSLNCLRGAAFAVAILAAVGAAIWAVNSFSP